MTATLGLAPRWHQAGKLLLLALAYFAAGKLGMALSIQDNHIALLWLPAGISVAALLRWGISCWPGVFLGALLIDFSLGLSPLLTVATAGGSTLGPLATAWLLKRWQFDHTFARQRDLMLLIGGAALGMLASASTAVSLMWLDGAVPAAGAPLAWLHWWLGDTVGVLLAGPLLLSITRTNHAEILRRPIEAALCGLLLGVAAWLSFFTGYGGQSLPLAFIPLPLVLWAALRLGVTGTSLAVLMVALLATIGTALGMGAFGAMPESEGMYLAWLYMFTVLLTGLMVTTVLAERNKTEQSLQRANELLALAQREAKAGVWDWDLSNNKLTWSDELFLLFGLDPKTSEGTLETWQELLHPADRQAASDRVSVAVRDRTALYNEHRIILPNGETKWIVAIGNISHDPDTGTDRMTGLCIDITAQKEAQQRARRSESHYQTLIQQAAEALIVHDFDGRFVEVNQQACDALGYSREELLQMGLQDIVPDFDLEAERRAWNRLEQGKPTSITSTHKRRDGSTFPVEVRFAALNIDGERLVMGLANNISARVRAEELLLESMRRLEEKELAKTRFLAAAGHDLRQPVAAANLFVDTLKLTSPTPRQSELIEKLEQSMNNFSGLLEHLLDISRFDSGLVKPQITSFDLVDLFNRLEQSFADPARDKGLHLRFFFPKNQSLIVRTDIGLLQSVLMNLVSNAIKFTAHGGILISARPRDGKVLLQVWDTGIGIADVYQPHIFDEFYQVANPQHSREGGLGLGLSICRRAMSLLEGKIVCRSRPVHGSVFELTLPLNSEPASARSLDSSASNAADELWASGKRIVVVEDDVLVATGMATLLQGLGAEVRHFINAEEALSHDDIADADYFIVDYSLGGKLSGFQFLETLQHRQHTLIRAVILTGETSSQFIRSVEDSPWPVLHKPANYVRIAACLNIQY
ncbi:MAG: MASE1 domain-containing protein [Gallionella sp.]